MFLVMYERFLHRLARADPDLLQRRRPQGAQQHRRQDQHDGADARQQPGLAHHVREEEDGTQHCYDSEDLLAGQDRVVTRVGNTGEELGIGGGQAVPVEPVAEGLEQDEQTKQYGELHLRRAGGLLALRGRAEPAVQVVGDDRGDQ